MESTALLALAFEDLHKELLTDVGDLTPDELFWQPGEGMNHIGFLLWHLVRDEDTVICQSVLRRPELWVTGGWSARLAMDATEQGTGFESGKLEHFRYKLPDLLGYAREVWQQTSEALRDLAPTRLEEPLAWSAEWRLANLLTTGSLAHGWVHLGEIRQLRGLRGWKFRE